MKTYIALIWIATLTRVGFAAPPIPPIGGGAFIPKPPIPIRVPRVVGPPVNLLPPPVPNTASGSLLTVKAPLPVPVAPDLIPPPKLVSAPSVPNARSEPKFKVLLEGQDPEDQVWYRSLEVTLLDDEGNPVSIFVHFRQQPVKNGVMEIDQFHMPLKEGGKIPGRQFFNAIRTYGRMHGGEGITKVILHRSDRSQNSLGRPYIDNKNKRPYTIYINPPVPVASGRELASFPTDTVSLAESQNLRLNLAGKEPADSASALWLEMPGVSDFQKATGFPRSDKGELVLRSDYGNSELPRQFFGLGTLERLGAGAQGTVYRIHPNSKAETPYILKRYHQDGGDEDYFSSDIKTLDALQELDQGGNRFNTQKLLKVDVPERTLMMADVRGWQLAVYVRMLKVSELQIAERLVEIYNARAKQLMSDLQERGWTVEPKIQTGDYFSFAAKGPNGEELVPSPTNTIFDPLTGKMWIVDPG